MYIWIMAHNEELGRLIVMKAFKLLEALREELAAM